MASAAPAWPDMSDAIPIFPLAGAMLLPYGRLPLNVFEPRYLALVDDALAVGRLFGMIQPDASKPETAAGPALFGVGCLGRITSFTETGDGRMLISLIGVVRFAVVEELASQRGYRRVRGDFGAYAQDVGEEPSGIGMPRARLLGELRGYFSQQGLDADWDSIGQLDDASLLTALCMMCPFSPSEKQALLEAPGVPERAEVLLALLRIGMHGTEGPPGGLRPS
jgi:Lon protease-like protein